MARILIIEDEDIVREPLTGLLRFDKHDVTAVATGEEGLECIRRSPPEIILCDVMLPGINGHDVLAELKATPLTQHIPVIFLSARVDAAAVKVGLALGAADYLCKPVSREVLTAAIMKLIPPDNVPGN